MRKTNSDLLTVIIPTCDRADTLLHCLRTVASQQDARLEIIVSDNYSSPETKAVVDSFQHDPRLRYIRTESRLGMSEHWDFALNRATGNWVTFIGDDDGLLPDAVRMFFALTEGKEVRAVLTNTGKFWWPHPAERTPSRLIVPFGRGTEMRATGDWLSKVMSGQYKYHELPYIYTGGFVRRDVIDDVRAKSGGAFFHAMSPDVYSGIAVALTLDEYLYSRTPLALSGLSRHSNGQAQMVQKEKDPQKIQFFRESTIGFHPRLGSGVIKSEYMCVYEAFLRAQQHYETDLDIKMEDQLALVVVYAGKDGQDETAAYCAQVCADNGIDFSAVQKKMPALTRRKKFLRMKENIARQFPFSRTGRRKKISGDPELNNIYDAVQRAGALVSAF
ncbi:MAG: glycosyltransferase family 2 protein [Alphaproteobacteria bacterium]|nr:glycosyltransferase family 2 protein [Alphaproteobacteria bacterium]